MVILEKLERARKLVIQGRLDEARVVVDELKRQKDITRSEQLECELVKIDVLMQQAHFNESIELIKLILNESTSVRMTYDAYIIKIQVLWRVDKYDECLKAIDQCRSVLTKLNEEQPENEAGRKAKLLNYESAVYWRKGDLDKGLELIQQSYELLDGTDNYYDLSQNFFLQGVFYSLKGELDRGIKCCLRSIDHAQEIGFEWAIQGNLGNIAEAYRTKGDLNKALEYCQKALAQYEKMGLKYELCIGLGNMGLINNQKGNLDEALKYYHKALTIADTIGQNVLVAYNMDSIGWVCKQNGDWERALEYFQQSLVIFNKIGNPQDISISLFHLITLLTENRSLERAQEYLNELQRIDGQQENILVNQRLRVAEAVVLKMGTRAREKIRASDLLEEVLKEEIVENEIAVFATLNLCELLLEELKAYGEEEVLQKINTHVENLQRLAQKQHSFSLLVNLMILKAKLAIIEGNLESAEELLKQAIEMSEKYGLDQLSSKAIEEENQLKNQYEEWQKLIQSNASFKERLERAQLDAYVTQAKKLISLEK